MALDESLPRLEVTGIDPVGLTVTAGRPASRTALIGPILDRWPDRAAVLGCLLDAVAQALDGGRRVALAARTTEEGVMWAGAAGLFTAGTTAARITVGVHDRLDEVVADGTALVGVVPRGALDRPGIPDLPLLVLDVDDHVMVRPLPTGQVWETGLRQQVPVGDWSRLALPLCHGDRAGLLDRLADLDRISRLAGDPADAGVAWPLAVGHLTTPSRSGFHRRDEAVPAGLPTPRSLGRTVVRGPGDGTGPALGGGSAAGGPAAGGAVAGGPAAGGAVAGGPVAGGPAAGGPAAGATGGRTGAVAGADLLLTRSADDLISIAARTVLHDPATAALPEGTARLLVLAVRAAMRGSADQCWSLVEPARGAACWPDPDGGGEVIEAAVSGYLEAALNDERWLMALDGVPLPAPFAASREIRSLLRGHAEMVLSRLRRAEPADEVRHAAVSLRVIDLLVRMEQVVRGSIVGLKDAVAMVDRIVAVLLSPAGPRLASLVIRIDERTLTYLVGPAIKRRLDLAPGLPGQRMHPEVAQLLVPDCDLAALATRPDLHPERDPVLCEAVVARCTRGGDPDPRLRVAAGAVLLRPGVTWPAEYTSQECAERAFEVVRGPRPWRHEDLLAVVEAVGKGLDLGLARHLMSVVLAEPPTEAGCRLLAALRPARGQVRGREAAGSAPVEDDGAEPVPPEPLTPAETALLDVMSWVGPEWYLEDGGFPARALDVLGVGTTVWDRLAVTDRPRAGGHVVVAALQMFLALGDGAPREIGRALRERSPRQAALLVDLARQAVPAGLGPALPIFEALMRDERPTGLRAVLLRHCLLEVLRGTAPDSSFTTMPVPSTDHGDEADRGDEAAIDLGRVVIRHALRGMDRRAAEALLAAAGDALQHEGRPLNRAERHRLQRWWRPLLPEAERRSLGARLAEVFRRRRHRGGRHL